MSDRARAALLIAAVIVNIATALVNVQAARRNCETLRILARRDATEAARCANPSR